MKSFDTFKDLHVTLDKDRPGSLAKAATAIANAGINIEGFCEVDGQFHTVTSDPAGTKRVLESAGYKVKETDVVVLPAEDRPGFLAEVLERITQDEINVGVAYTLTNTRIAISADQVSKLKGALQELATTATRRR
ncbi:MAG TPA: hypothetical protein VJP45_06095 [Candidatus Limnocylindria bacterium]|nr:hypothetical protein [Candidatus Limnocylindria bacterium]